VFSNVLAAGFLSLSVSKSALRGNKEAQCKVFEFLLIYPRGGLKSAGLQNEFLLAAATLLMKLSGRSSSIALACEV